MANIFGGGGSQKSKTEALSEYPAEFKPLASSSVKQIQAAQDALPLAAFTSPQPQQVAGLSPYTLAGMELVPFTAQTTQPEQSLYAMQNMWRDLANRAVGYSVPSPTSVSSSNFLLGRVGEQGGLSPGSAAPLSFPEINPLSASVFGQGAPTQFPYLTGQGPLPSIQGAGTSIPVTPLMPTAPIAAPAAAPQIVIIPAGSQGVPSPLDTENPFWQAQRRSDFYPEWAGYSP